MTKELEEIILQGDCLEEMKKDINKDKLIISVCSGFSVEQIRKNIDYNGKYYKRRDLHSNYMMF